MCIFHYNQIILKQENTKLKVYVSMALYNINVVQLVEKGTKLVLEQVVTTIASVADTSEEQFVAYYDR
jgi:hypothetical protein